MSDTKRETEPFGFATLAVHAGARPDPTTGARTTPIFQSNAYVFQDTDHAAELFNLQTFGFIYSRITNPTVSVLEERVAALENGRGAVACATGHAAQFLVAAALLDVGDEFVASNNLYGGSITQFGVSFKKLGWHCNFVDMTDPDNLRAAMNEKTKFVFCELLANPGGVVLDLEPLADIAREWGVPMIVDNTLATPYLCRPFDWGADIIVHSATKYIGGHGNTMGGVVVESGRFDWNQNDKFPSMTQPDPAYHGLTFAETFGDFGFSMKVRAVALRDYGPTLSAQSAWNILQGVETLPLRMERHCANAQAVAEYLSGHAKVAWVSYAGLPDNPYHELAKKYLPKGAGAVFTFGVKGGFAAGETVVNSVEIFSHLANVGDTRSLIIHPASTTHRQLSPEQRDAAGAGEDVIRLSIGIETLEDIIADLDQALART
jgi:O-acetylhomoserine (thiol)-lyase